MAIVKQILPGVYANIIAGDRDAALSARGTVAMALDLDWGAPLTTLLRGNSAIAPLGYDLTEPKLKLVREVIQNAGTLLLYRLNAGKGQPAQGTLAAGITVKAVYPGTRGNDIKVTVEKSGEIFVIRTYLGTREMDAQAVTKPEDFIQNSYIKIEGTGKLESKTITLTGGSNGEATSAAGHDAFFDEIRKHEFNVLCYTGTDTATKGKYAAFAEELEQAGIYTQVVMNNPAAKGVNIINNTVGGSTAQYDLTAAEACATMAGIQAGCGIEKSATHYPVDHWIKVNPVLDRWQQQARTAAGEILFVEMHHKICVLSDINTLTAFDAEHPEDWSKNPVIRTLRAMTADIKKLLDEKAIGKIRNNRDGRNEIKSKCIGLITENYLDNGYIEDFTADDVVVNCMGDTARDSVMVKVGVRVVDTMDKIYLTVVSK